ncbi:MAG: TetR/AcrR family transcriptional regulator [Clostridia bacterium]|nr:TetR/AcrR family transcriptional regulator [Clostridia bacterium]
MDSIRTPKQQRAIETKTRIIKAGYELFAQKGYYNTNTTEIAKQAGVSTGIVYGYFHDKRDILVDVLDIYIEQAFAPIFNVLEHFVAPLDFARIIPQILDAAVAVHRDNAAMHETLHALSSSDKAVGDKFMALEEEVTRRMADALRHAGYQDPALYEKVHWAMDSVQSFAHECVYDQHAYIDYAVLRRIEETAIYNLFQ